MHDWHKSWRLWYFTFLLWCKCMCVLECVKKNNFFVFRLVLRKICSKKHLQVWALKCTWRLFLRGVYQPIFLEYEAKKNSFFFTHPNIHNTYIQTISYVFRFQCVWNEKNTVCIEKCGKCSRQITQIKYFKLYFWFLNRKLIIHIHIHMRFITP